jgi:hypothetical protein
MLLDTTNSNIFGLEEGIASVFEILGHVLFKGDRTTIYSHDLHTIRCYFTQETTKYLV